MFFNNDRFTKEIQQLTQIISAAEKLVSRAENDGNARHLSQINKTLGNASQSLQSLYKQIAENMTTWDESILKRRKGEYENIVNRYKSLQQRIESIHSGPQYTPSTP